MTQRFTRLKGSFWAALAFALAASTSAPALTLEPAFPHHRFVTPLQVVPDRDGSGRVLVVQQDGLIVLAQPGSRHFEPFLDLRGKVRMSHAEEGLLSLALHPKFLANGRAFVWYSVPGVSPRRNRLSEFKADESREHLVPGSERVLLEVEKRWGNHNGACLRFGPDGYLYFGLGDGGSGGDPLGNAQNPYSLLGKMLRIDVDHIPDAGAYGIPQDNPFVHGGGLSEIYAMGLRNPWRMAFDSATGALWVGDVGQDKWEEVDIVTKGGNYGWNWREGSHPYAAGTPPAGLTDPLYDYGHDQGRCITGGVVVRHGHAKSLKGRYLFADFVVMKLWSLDADTRSRDSLRDEGTCPEPPASLDLDSSGDVWISGYSGTLYKVKD